MFPTGTSPYLLLQRPLRAKKRKKDRKSQGDTIEKRDRILLVIDYYNLLAVTFLIALIFIVAEC